MLGVALTRMDGRNRKTNGAMLEFMQETWGDLLLPTWIGVNDALSQAQTMGQDIYSYDAKSRGAQHYKALAELLLERMA